MRAASCEELISRTYREMYAPVCGYVAKRIGDVADVEDIVQDVFEALLRPDLLLTPDTVKKYLYSIAHNHIVDYFRRRACGGRAQEWFFINALRTAEDADWKLAAEELRHMEGEVLNRVGEKARTVYEMFVHEDKSVKDIAVRMDISERTVENHVFRTRMKVRKAIGKAI